MTEIFREALDFSILIRGGKGEKNREIGLKAPKEEVDVNGAILTFTKNQGSQSYEIHPSASSEITVNEQAIQEATVLKSGDKICIDRIQIIIFFALGEATFEFPLKLC
jgi:hypothetical protein